MNISIFLVLIDLEFFMAMFIILIVSQRKSKSNLGD